MPLVEYKCSEHGKCTVFHNIKDEYSANCSECGKKMDRVWNTFGFTFEFKEGFDPSFGRYVGSKRERDNLLKEKGWEKVRD